MEWRDEGILIAVRPHGETSAIVEVVTAAHGRHAGVVRGGASRRMAPVLQPGAQVDVAWRARLDGHIGTFRVEPVRSRSAILSDARALAALNATCALLHLALPEREPHPAIYAATTGLADALCAGEDWLADYLRWELRLLEDLGYGLDLGRCALTGTREDLAYVSPASGRAVARDAAGAWADRLLPLPPCLLGQGAASPSEAAAGLRTTGHFLARLLADLDRTMPAARLRLAAALSRS
ncbi:MAG: DNA repair protein RecO [Pseudomonadota bacterium]